MLPAACFSPLSTNIFLAFLLPCLCSFGGVEETFVMGDVAFGACCVDDFSAEALVSGQ